MAWDDPVVWVLIVAAVVFLFGSSRIPQFARALGQARREFGRGWQGITEQVDRSATAETVSPSQAKVSSNVDSVEEDPLLKAAKTEGLVTSGKTKQQIAEELAWKLRKK